MAGTVPAESIENRVRRIVAEFSALGDPIDRYRRLAELGERMPQLEAALRTEENRLPGCQYALWIACAYDPGAGVLRFCAYSDARITRGLAALIIAVLDGQPPRAVADARFDFLDTIGLRAQLSSQRADGLAAMIAEVRRRARIHLDGHAEPA
ncbi:MAG: SufE family protein [Gemmatimonadetes bacterium]|nr:SufE family protein [Gemmatimonadota bacterium]